MKNIIALFSGMFLLGVTGVVLAAATNEPVTCPSASTIRDMGVNLTHGYMDNQGNDYLWYIYSAPYSGEGTNFVTWQTFFEENLPDITNPATAVIKAQEDLNSLVLMNPHDSYLTGDGVTVCSYAPTNANYRVLAMNTVDASYNSLKR